MDTTFSVYSTNEYELLTLIEISICILDNIMCKCTYSNYLNCYYWWWQYVGCIAYNNMYVSCNIHILIKILCMQTCILSYKSLNSMHNRDCLMFLFYFAYHVHLFDKSLYLRCVDIRLPYVWRLFCMQDDSTLLYLAHST